MTKLGYILARDEIDVHSQGLDLQAAGMEEPHIDYVDNDLIERPELKALLAKLIPGDTLVVTRLGHLATSSDGAVSVIIRVAEAGAGIHAIWDEITISPEDVRRASRVIEVLESIDTASAPVAQVAPAAKPRLNRAGRPKSLTPEQISHARQSIARGEQTASSMARLLKVNKTTLWRALREETFLSVSDIP